MATILLDDNSDALVLGTDAVYETLTSQNFIGGSAVAIFSGSLDCVFSGTEIAIFGRVNKNDSSTWGVPTPNIGEVLIDGVPIESNVTIPDEVAIGMIYQLPQLSDTKHILTLSNVSSIILDFIQVTTSNTTSLSGSTLLLTSSDTAISYEGNWTQNTAILVDDDHQYRRPIGGATRDASFGNASVTIGFIGTSITVSGTHYPDPRAPCSPIFYLDGDEQFYPSPRRSGPNYPLFSSQRFPNGSHVLTIDLTANTAGAHFSLEYILYTASENLDKNSSQVSSQVPSSVLIGVGIGVGVVVIGILLVILWWWNRRRSRIRQSETAVTASDTSGMLNPAHQDLDTDRMNQLVEKSSFPDSARILTSHDLSAVRVPTRQNEPITSVETRPVSSISNRSPQVQRPPHSEGQEIKPLVPRRREPELSPREPPKKIQSRSLPETSSQRFPQVPPVQKTAPPGTGSNSQRPDHKLRPDRSQNVISGGAGVTPDLPEGAWGMRVQQLEELMRELREGTAPSEIGQDQVGTGHSTTLQGMMEEISALPKPVERDQSRGEERSSVRHRNAV